MGRLVFVSTELYPYTAGGVGRVLFNMLRAMSDVDRARVTVVLVDRPVDVVLFASTFPGARLTGVDSAQDADRLKEGRRHPPRWAYTNTIWHWLSAAVYRALAALAEEGESIDYVEFPDWGALGFCTLQERRFSGFLDGATISVRLHSSHAALMHAEPRAISLDDLNVSDLERKCLRDCDLIVTQLDPISAIMRELFGFSKDEWDPRVIRHAPPVLLDHHALAYKSVAASNDQSIIFTSKMQRIKRPDLVARGVAGFMRRRKEYTGEVILGAHSNDEAYDAQVQKLIPRDLAPRFRFMPKMQSIERETVIAASTVVVPSGFESFCLAAYEASLLGARVILNGANPAFGDGTPWHDGVNCFKFDGTSIGLTAALERSFDYSLALQAVEVLQDSWPWEAVIGAARRWQPLQEQPLVSIVVPHYNLGAHVMETLDNVVEQTWQNIEIVLVDDASTDTHSTLVVDALARASDPRLKVVRLVGNAGLPAARNIAIRHAEGKYVLTLDADDLIDPSFVARGVQALENNPSFDIVVTPAAYFMDGELSPLGGGGSKENADYAVFSGEAMLAGVLENRFSTATALFRKTALERFLYDEHLNCYEDWSLYMRMCDAGLRFIVTTDVFFFYRKRGNSMVHAPRDAHRRHIDYLDLIRTSAPAALRARSLNFALGLHAPAMGSVQTTVPPELQCNNAQEQQVVFASLKMSRWLARRSPFVLHIVMAVSRRLWRGYRNAFR